MNARFDAMPQRPTEDGGQEKKKQQEEALNGLIDMFGRDKVQIDE